MIQNNFKDNKKDLFRNITYKFKMMKNNLKIIQNNFKDNKKDIFRNITCKFKMMKNN